VTDFFADHIHGRVLIVPVRLRGMFYTR